MTKCVTKMRQRRHRHVRCAQCRRKEKINPRGRVPRFCSRSCRQRAYERRKWQKPTPVELLARAVDSMAVRQLVREEVRKVLQELGLAAKTPVPPLVSKKSRPELRLIHPDEPSNPGPACQATSPFCLRRSPPCPVVPFLRCASLPTI